MTVVHMPPRAGPAPGGDDRAAEDPVPHDLPAEQAVLGGMVLDPSVVVKVVVSVAAIPHQ